MLNVKKVFTGFDNDFKDEILEVISYGFNDNSLDELISYLSDTINDNGAIDELIDNNIDIYYYDLRKWSVDNYEYIEQYYEEFGMPDKFDFHRSVQGGQYVYYNEFVNECINDMIDYVNDKYDV